MNTLRLAASLMLGVVLAPSAWVSGAVAQSPPPSGNWGVGLQAGSLSGLSAKVFSNRLPRRFDALAATVSLNARGYVFGQFVGLDEIEISASPLTLYLGTGPVAELKDTSISSGLAAVSGVRFLKSLFEIYLELSPRLMLTPDRSGVLAAGVGFRVYL